MADLTFNVRCLIFLAIYDLRITKVTAVNRYKTIALPHRKHNCDLSDKWKRFACIKHIHFVLIRNDLIARKDGHAAAAALNNYV